MNPIYAILSACGVAPQWIRNGLGQRNPHASQMIVKGLSGAAE
jgi:hypothetical protein